MRNLDWSRFAPSLGPCWRAVERLSAALEREPCAAATLDLREALLSSLIEGVEGSPRETARLDALRGAPPGAARARPASREAHACLEAVREARRPGDGLAKAQALRVHAVLMKGPHGRGKAPGRLRDKAVWIGARGSTPETALSVPPPPEEVPELLGRWQWGVQGDALVQAALMHAEFERIHPFVDGNGRTGRALLAAAIPVPAIALSPAVMNRRGAYYEGLASLSQGAGREAPPPGSEPWALWTEWMLERIREGAEASARTAQAVGGLRGRIAEAMQGRTGIPQADELAQTVLSRPAWRASDLVRKAKGLGLTPRRTKSALGRLRETGIVEAIEEAAGRRPAVLAAGEALRLAARGRPRARASGEAGARREA